MPGRLFKIAVKIKKGGEGGWRKERKGGEWCYFERGEGMLVRLSWPRWWEVILVRALIKA